MLNAECPPLTSHLAFHSLLDCIIKEQNTLRKIFLFISFPLLQLQQLFNLVILYSTRHFDYTHK